MSSKESKVKYKKSDENSFDAQRQFVEMCVELLDSLYEELPDEGDLISIRTLIVSNVFSAKKLLDNFKERVLPHREKISRREDSYFLNERSMFDGVDNGKVSKFKDIWSGDSLDKDAKKSVWDYFDVLIKIADKYFMLLSKEKLSGKEKKE